jgi:hypothetical protein
LFGSVPVWHNVKGRRAEPYIRELIGRFATVTGSPEVIRKLLAYYLVALKIDSQLQALLIEDDVAR